MPPSARCRHDKLITGMSQPAAVATLIGQAISALAGPGRAHYRRKLTEGKSPKEALRCLIGGLSRSRSAWSGSCSSAGVGYLAHTRTGRQCGNDERPGQADRSREKTPAAGQFRGRSGPPRRSPHIFTVRWSQAPVAQLGGLPGQPSCLACGRADGPGSYRIGRDLDRR
jgi:hypothetical protein